jgi:hypothetical protein
MATIALQDSKVIIGKVDSGPFAGLYASCACCLCGGLPLEISIIFSGIQSCPDAIEDCPQTDFSAVTWELDKDAPDRWFKLNEAGTMRVFLYCNDSVVPNTFSVLLESTSNVEDPIFISNQSTFSASPMTVYNTLTEGDCGCGYGGTATISWE